MTEVVKGKIWTFDQLQGTLYVHVPVRMTVLKLGGSRGKGGSAGGGIQSGGLFVFAPVAPTAECLGMVRALEAEHGPVKFVVLPTIAVEHKVFAGVFAQKFPKASVWCTRDQYSFPLNLPLELLGFPLGRTFTLPEDPSQTPWAKEYPGELSYASLGPFKAKGTGGFGETTFFHADTKTVLVVDAVVKIPTSPPAIMLDDPRALLYHSRDDFRENVADTSATRLKGWQRVVLFGLFFMPKALTVVETAQCVEDAKTTPQAMKSLGWGGLYPFEWDNALVGTSFRALQKGSGLLVAPILQTLILNRNPGKVLEWADEVAAWPFTRVIPCHLESPIRTNPRDFRNAFSFLEEGSGIGGLGRARPVPVAEDFKTLEEAEVGLIESGSLFERGKKVRRSSSGGPWGWW